MYQKHLEKLEKEHRELNKKIDVMEKTGIFDDVTLEEMKKHRLHLKDQIAKMHSKHPNEEND